MRPLIIAAALVLGTACAGTAGKPAASPTTTSTVRYYSSPTTTTTLDTAMERHFARTPSPCPGKTLASCRIPGTAPRGAAASVDDTYQTERRIRELERQVEWDRTMRNLEDLESR